MSDEMDFQIFRKYEKLVRRGIAKPLTCSRCNNEMKTVFGERDEPRLYCAFCNTLLRPTRNVYDDIVAQVREFF